ncbi:MAG: hypothetical protein OEY31_02565 [Candidatus Bathyarchaeota archaeon]|nr:hypothetical protein [Candidatus Bathyarchaeota archaeon]
MISDEPWFLRFGCLSAPLMIEEKEAWKRRHEYPQPIVPSRKILYFVSKEDSPIFIDKEAIDEVTLNSNAKDHYNILRFLVHQALKILFELNDFSKWRGFYSKRDYMAAVSGRFGLNYSVFSGVIPRAFFENGYCMIAFDYGSMVFARFSRTIDRDILKKLFLITLCEDCPESYSCPNTRHKVSRFSRLGNTRVFMVDIEGGKFGCPDSYVRVESSPRVMKGEYSRILRLTAPTTAKEQQFVSDLIKTVSRDDFKLNLGRDFAFSWLELEA